MSQSGLRFALSLVVRVFAFFLCILNVAWSPAEAAKRTYSREQGGYVSDARREDRSVGKDLELIEVPLAIRSKLTLREQIFDGPLSQEFTQRYRDTFGNTPAEITYRNVQRFGNYDSLSGQWVNVEAEQERESAFADYMLRRMVEYHVDNYSKNKPELKEAYELKEQLTAQQVSVAPGYAVKSQYSISGNYLDLEFVNPFVGSRVRADFGSALSGPEVRFSLDRWITTKVLIETQYLLNDGVGRLVARRTLTPHSSVSLTGSTYFKSSGVSVREHLGLIGYSLGF